MNAHGFSLVLNTVVGLGIWNQLLHALYLFKTFFFSSGGRGFLSTTQGSLPCLAGFYYLGWKNESKAIPLCRLMPWWCDFKSTRKDFTDISFSIKFVIWPWSVPSFTKINQHLKLGFQMHILVKGFLLKDKILSESLRAWEKAVMTCVIDSWECSPSETFLIPDFEILATSRKRKAFEVDVCMCAKLLQLCLTLQPCGL